MKPRREPPPMRQEWRHFEPWIFWCFVGTAGPALLALLLILTLTIFGVLP